MKIKKRHVKMARAARRTDMLGIARRYDSQERLFKPLLTFLLCPARLSVLHWWRSAEHANGS